MPFTVDRATSVGGAPASTMMNDSSRRMSFSFEYSTLRLARSVSDDAEAISCEYSSLWNSELLEFGSVARPLLSDELGSSWAKVEFARYRPRYLRLTASSTHVASSSARTFRVTPILARSA